MKKLFDITLKSRKKLLEILENTPKEELLLIPKGFNNNIWWNIAHVVSTHQILIYRFSGLETHMDGQLVDKFKKGTYPVGQFGNGEFQLIHSLLLDTEKWAREDYEKGLFASYQPYTTSANVTLNAVEDAIAFNVYHEGLHRGNIIGLQRAIAGSQELS